MEENKKFTVGKLISFIICLIGIGLCVLVGVMSIVDADGEISDIVWTEKALDEYRNNPDGFRVEYYKAYEDHYFTEDGYFSVSKIRYMPTVSQWQMTVRYNKSTIENLNYDYGLKLDTEDDNFTFALVDNTGKLYTDFEYRKTVKGRYTYYRIVVEDLSVIKLDEVGIRIYFTKDIKDGEYPEKPLAELPMYNSQMPRNEYKFKKELPEDDKPDKDLLPASELLK